VTLAIPEELLRWLKILAARQDTSISALLTATLSDLADREEGYAEARDAMIRDMKGGYSVSFWDGLILRSAQASQCSVLWSEDLSHGRRWGNLEVRNPFSG
jgi:predicted nucleic acid-binding protein